MGGASGGFADPIRPDRIQHGSKTSTSQHLRRFRLTPIHSEHPGAHVSTMEHSDHTEHNMRK